MRLFVNLFAVQKQNKREQALPEWPLALLDVYMYDALGSRQWVSHSRCKLLVDNLRTAWEVPLSPPPRMPSSGSDARGSQRDSPGTDMSNKLALGDGAAASQPPSSGNPNGSSRRPAPSPSSATPPATKRPRLDSSPEGPPALAPAVAGKGAVSRVEASEESSSGEEEVVGEGAAVGDAVVPVMIKKGLSIHSMGGGSGGASSIAITTVKVQTGGEDSSSSDGEEFVEEGGHVSAALPMETGGGGRAAANATATAAVVAQATAAAQALARKREEEAKTYSGFEKIRREGEYDNLPGVCDRFSR